MEMLLIWKPQNMKVPGHINLYKLVTNNHCQHVCCWLQTTIVCLICFSEEEVPQTKLENYIRLFHPNQFTRKVLEDGFWVIRAFQEGLSIYYNENHKLFNVKAALRSEISESLMNILHFLVINQCTEFKIFLANPLQYYNSETVDLFFYCSGK